MSFTIEHLDIQGRHITFNSDGTITLWIGEEGQEKKRITLDDRQARILKAMVWAENNLYENE